MTQLFRPKLGWQLFSVVFWLFWWVMGVWQCLDRVAPLGARIVLSSAMGLIGLVGLLMLLCLPKVVVQESGIEVVYPLKRKRVAWDSVRELSRHGKGDMTFKIGSAQERMTVYCEYLEKGEKLRILLLRRVVEPTLAERLVWTPYGRAKGLYWGASAFFGGFAICAAWFGSNTDPVVGWVGAGVLFLFCVFMWLYSAGTFWVTQRSVRADVMWGWRREILWEHIVSVEVGLIGENLEHEAVFIQGVRGKIVLDSALTPQYAQVRDLVIRRAKERSQLLR